MYLFQMALSGVFWVDFGVVIRAEIILLNCLPVVRVFLGAAVRHGGILLVRRQLEEAGGNKVIIAVIVGVVAVPDLADELGVGCDGESAPVSPGSQSKLRGKFYYKG